MFVESLKDRIGSRPVYIWGAGEVGAAAYEGLRALGITPEGFVDTYLRAPLREELRAVAVAYPTDIPANAYVVIAARASVYAIMLELMNLGFGSDRVSSWGGQGEHSLLSDNDKLLLQEVFVSPVCKSIPSNVLTLETSDRCNLLCIMCGYQKLCRHKGLHKGPEPKFDCAPIEPVLKTVKSLVLNIAGEPLLKGAIWDVLDPMEKDGYSNLKSIQFHTNGQLLDENDNIERLAKLPVPLTISFSVDAVNAETYRRIRGADFGRVIGNMKRLLAVFEAAGRKDDNLQINATLFRENIEQFPEFIRMAYDLGFKTVITRPIAYRYENDYSWARLSREGLDYDNDQQALQYYPQLTKRIIEEAKAEAERLGIHLYVDDAFEVSVYSDAEDLPYPMPVGDFKAMTADRKKKGEEASAMAVSRTEGVRIPMKRKCYRPWTDVSIQKDGGVCMCLWLAGKLIGNINDAPFEDAWNSPRAQRIRQDIIDGFLPDECENTVCKYRHESVMAYRLAAKHEL